MRASRLSYNQKRCEEKGVFRHSFEFVMNGELWLSIGALLSGKTRLEKHKNYQRRQWRWKCRWSREKEQGCNSLIVLPAQHNSLTRIAELQGRYSLEYSL
ncbi:hypothetical protein TSUD_169690 [Trifolium subterraneum]|nr:hypothetical protein TSUD_169690 [Trifolium subterraneum]